MVYASATEHETATTAERISGKTDRLTPERRSWNMSRIRSKDTKPEMVVRKALHKAGFRYRLHVKDLPGKPDIVLPKYRTVIFVHGCFWHQHPGCKEAVIPKTRTEWWTTKLNKNKVRDEEVRNGLMKKGWNVLEIFECEVKTFVQGLSLETLKTIALP
jgi:DNA mismatch endonuclease (patch repair protein)